MKYSILFLALFSTSALALDTEISVGKTNFSRQEDGVWWQSPYAHNENINSNSFSIGLTKKVSDSWRSRFGYQYLGQATSNCIGVSDAQFTAYLTGDHTITPKYRWIGHGEVHMIYATIAPEFNIKDFTVSPELGLNAYVPRWKGTLYDLRGKILQNWHHKQTVQFTPSIGLSIAYGNVSVAATYIYRTDAAGDEFPAIYHDKATNVSLRYTF